MPVAVLRPFGPRGTVETPIARSHSMPSRARRMASSYHISGYLGQRDEPLTHLLKIFMGFADYFLSNVVTSVEITGELPLNSLLSVCRLTYMNLPENSSGKTGKKCYGHSKGRSTSHGENSRELCTASNCRGRSAYRSHHDSTPGAR